MMKRRRPRQAPLSNDMEHSFIEALLPMHPKLVHFPIGLMLSAACMQALGLGFKKEAWRSAAWVMFVLAAITMPMAGLAGLWEENRLHLRHPVLDEHKFYAFSAMGSTLAAGIVLWSLKSGNNKVFQWVFLAPVLAISFLLVSAAHEGGEMVYEYGVGVSR